MRLTVHLSEAKRHRVEVNTKNGPVSKMKTFNTLSFPGVTEADVPSILQSIKDDDLGKVTGHYLSGEKTIGRSRGKKK